MTDSQRIGQSILPTSLTTKVNICITSRQEQSVSIYAHIFFLTSKVIKDYKLTSQLNTALLLDKGDGTNVPFDGTSYTAMLPINKAEYTQIAHKKILLTKGQYNPNVAYTLGDKPSSSTYKYFASFSQKIPLPKKLQYVGTNDTRPSNSFPFMCCAFTATDQHGVDILSTSQLRVQAQSHIYYKDA